MKPYRLLLLLLLNPLYLLFAQAKLSYPITTSKPVTDNVHGFLLTDPYRWLEDKSNAEVKEWTKMQHDFSINYLSTTYPEIPGLKEELAKIIDKDENSAPVCRGNFQFYYSKKRGQLQNKLFAIVNGKHKLLFDPLKIDPSGKTAITNISHSRNSDRMAVAVQHSGDEINTYYILDVKTGRQIGSPLGGLNYLGFTYDDRYVYLQTRTQEMIDKQQPIKTYLHRVGDDMKNARFLIAPEDAKDFARVWDDFDDSITFYTLGDFYSNTVKIKKQGNQEEPKIFYSSKQFQASQIKIRHRKIFIMTNDHASNFKIMMADVNNPDFSQWKTFYGEKETVLSDFIPAENNVIIKDRKDIMTRLFAFDYQGKEIKQIELPELGYISSMEYHKQTDAVYVTLSVFTSPAKVYKLDCRTLSWSLFFEEKSVIELNDIESRLVFYPSYNGKKIPMFLVYKKGVTQDGKNPVYLWAYGGFNVGISPKFLSGIIPFIQRGGIYALAGLRGGDEYGENWHIDGMLNNKQNVFNDYFAAAEYLIREKYTNADRIAAEGRSNGGLLMGAVLTQRPDLFKVAVCGVPLLDMVRYHKFLIARYWIPEYGDPDKKEDFLNIIKYSPYHNIRMGLTIPTTLVIAGENDTRVDPLHAKKFVAALQNNPSQINPILLFMDYDSGHGSGASVEKQIYNAEIRWRFIMRELGM